MSFPFLTEKKYMLVILLAVFAFICLFIVNTYLVLIPTFDGGIRFDISEAFTNKYAGPKISLDASTTETYPCSDNILTNNYLVSDNNGSSKISINLGHTISPGVCTTSVGPASFSRIMNSENGNYTLEFHSINATDIYQIEVTDEEIRVEPVVSTFSKPTHATIRRIPKGLLEAQCSFGGLEGNNPDKGLCPRYLDEIGKIAAPYMIPEKGRIATNEYYLYNGTDAPLIDLISKYKREGFYLAITTYQGKTFRKGYNDESVNIPIALDDTEKIIKYAPLKLEIEYKESNVNPQGN
jgi:hypothetical protein